MSNFIFILIFRFLISIILVYFFVRIIKSRKGSFFTNFNSYILPVLLSSITLIHVWFFTLPAILDFTDLIYNNLSIRQCIFVRKGILPQIYISDEDEVFLSSLSIHINEQYNIGYLPRTKTIITMIDNHDSNLE